MNGLRLVLLLIISGYFVLLIGFRKKPHLAQNYMRYSAIVLACIVFASPFLWLIAAVFKDSSVFNEYVFFPPLSKWSAETINLSNFKELFSPRPGLDREVPFYHYIINSLFLASTTVVVQVFLCSLAGYALAKYDFKGKKLLMTYMLGSVMIPGMLLMAPVYKLIVDIQLVDTHWSLILPVAVGVYGIFLFRQAILGIPREILEAGRIDGASEFGIYFRLIMPLTRPMTAAFCLVSFLNSWNAFIGPNVFLHTQAKLPLPVILNYMMGVYSQEYGVYLAGTFLAIIPPAILFFSLQREFISGLTSGAVKE